MTKPRLTYRDDGSFTIVQFTDLHIVGKPEHSRAIYDVMERVVNIEQPDLVVLTGDVLYSPSCDDPLDCYRATADVVEGMGVPWAAIFGNHDAEQGTGTSKAQLMALQQSYANCLSEPGPVNIYGVGNYMIPILGADDTIATALYFLDTGEYTRAHPFVGYEWIRRSQIDWYVAESERLKTGNQGRIVPSIMFTHIPIPEFVEVWDRSVCYGERKERVCCPRVNSGLFTAMLEQGDVMGVIAGHDHANDYWGDLHGIRLCYGRTTGDTNGGVINRGARVIRLNANSADFDTWIREGDGTRIEQPAHEPEMLGKGVYYR